MNANPDWNLPADPIVAAARLRATAQRFRRNGEHFRLLADPAGDRLWETAQLYDDMADRLERQGRLDQPQMTPATEGHVACMRRIVAEGAERLARQEAMLGWLQESGQTLMLPVARETLAAMQRFQSQAVLALQAAQACSSTVACCMQSALDRSAEAD